MGDVEITDQVYEAALVPEQWPAALSALARVFDGRCAVLVAKGPETVRLAASIGHSHIADDYVSGGWAARSDRIERCARLGLRRFVTETDLYTEREVVEDPAFEGFFRPRGLGSEFGTLFSLPTGDLMVASVQRRHGAPPLGPASLAIAAALRPHIARAALISTRLGLERSRGAVAGLAAIGLPAASLSARGRILAANDLVPAHPSLRDVGGLLRVLSPDADAALSRCLAALDRGAAAVPAIPIPARDADPPSVLHLVPVRGAGLDVFTGATAVLVAVPASVRPGPDDRLLAALYGLTPAEARTASAVARFGGVPVVADRLRVSRETVKSQLSSVFAKTGTASQPGLVALLASLGAAAPPGVVPRLPPIG